MGLTVSAQVVRGLISEGEYIVECIEQREHGRVAVTLALRSRAEPYTIQVETGDSRLEGLFRALLNERGADSAKNPAMRGASQRIPVVQVDAMPTAQPRRRQRRSAEKAAPLKTPEAPKPSGPEKPLTRAKRRRSAIRQLVLVPPDKPVRPLQAADGRRRRARATSSPTSKSR